MVMIMKLTIHCCLPLVALLLQSCAHTTSLTPPVTSRPWLIRALFGPTQDEEDEMKRLKLRQYQRHRVGDFAEAEKQTRLLIPLQTRALGATHAETFESRLTLANLLYKQRKFDQSELECRDLLKLQERSLGVKSFDIEDSRFYLTCALDAQQKHAEAEVIYRKMLQDDEHRRGGMHRDTLLRCCNLACCLRAQGKLTEALALARRAENGDKMFLGPEDEDSKRAIRVRMEIEAALKKKQAKP